jgi:hypothetical protein
MKKIFIMVLLAIVVGATFTSCSPSKSGCKVSTGMIGYH